MKVTTWIIRFLFVGALTLDAPSALAQFQIAPLLRDSCGVPKGLRVIDCIDATGGSVGQVYHGPTTSYVNAHLAPTTLGWMKDATNCTNGPSEEDIILRFTRVSLAESSDGIAVRAGAYVDLEVFTRAGTNWLLRFRTSGMSVEDVPSNDTERHGRLLASTLTDCLKTYVNAKREGKLLDSAFVLDGVHLSPERVLSGPRDRYPILAMPQLPRGIFRSAEAFNRGEITPVADSSFRMDDRGNLHLLGDLKKERDDIWGLSDGVRYHVRLGRKFVPLSFDGTQFVGTVVRSSYTAEEQIALGFMFGGLGVLIALPSIERVPARLDLASGQLLPFDVQASDIPVEHIIHLSRFADASSSVSVSHGSGSIVLERDTYCALRFPPTTASELVRIVGPGGQMELALPVVRTGSTFHLIDLDEHGVPIEKKVTEQMEQSLRARLKTAMLRPPVEP